MILDFAFRTYCEHRSAMPEACTQRFLSSTYRSGYASLKNFYVRASGLYLSALATVLNAKSRINSGMKRVSLLFLLLATPALAASYQEILSSGFTQISSKPKPFLLFGEGTHDSSAQYLYLEKLISKGHPGISFVAFEISSEHQNQFDLLLTARESEISALTMQLTKTSQLIENETQRRAFQDVLKTVWEMNRLRIQKGDAPGSSFIKSWQLSRLT
ncbi:MAG: hypothetical protein AABZ06_15425 [Bdellovibrionota bacterium]